MFPESIARGAQLGFERIDDELGRGQIRGRSPQIDTDQLDEDNYVVTQNLLDGGLLEVGNL
jgi:hypothetical protein